jgi:IclR family KDG regulon transcriptional repressor
VSRKPKSEYLIQSVARALDLLEAFTAREASLGVTDLARRLGLHKNNVFRLLATLETRGYVDQDPETERYRLAPKVWEIAAAFLRHLDVRRQARPHLEALAAKSGESACLALHDRSAVVYVDLVESEQAVRVASRLGRRLPAPATASGRAVLSALPRAQREEALAGLPDAGALAERLQRWAADGYALDEEESEPGVVAVGAAVRDLSGRMAAVECLAPAYRWSVARLRSEIAPLVTGAARQVQQSLGVEPALS